MKKLLTEFLGTFFLVLVVGLTVMSGSALAPLAIGTVLMVMVYMGGHISGAHYNPAVTLAVALRGKMPRNDVVPYWVAQLLGSIAAAALFPVLARGSFAPAPGSGAGMLAPLLVEVLFTFALVLVVLNTAFCKATSGNSYYGLAIGFTVLAGAAAGGPISGGAFNPAVGVGPILVSALGGPGSFAHLWLYLVGPLFGGILAAVVFGIQEQEG